MGVFRLSKVGSENFVRTSIGNINKRKHDTQSYITHN